MAGALSCKDATVRRNKRSQPAACRDVSPVARLRRWVQSPPRPRLSRVGWQLSVGSCPLSVARWQVPAGRFPLSGVRGKIDRGGTAILLFFDVEAHFLAFVQTAQAGLLDSADMHEDVFAPSVRGDEPVSFGRVEPFHGAGRHGRSLSAWAIRPRLGAGALLNRGAADCIRDAHPLGRWVKRRLRAPRISSVEQPRYSANGASATKAIAAATVFHRHRPQAGGGDRAAPNRADPRKRRLHPRGSHAISLAGLA